MHLGAHKATGRESLKGLWGYVEYIEFRVRGFSNLDL